MLLTLLTSLTFRHDSSKAVTIFGWTPGLRALAGGGLMPCGCLSGSYTTWRGETVVIIDGRGANCPHAEHEENSVLSTSHVVR